MPLVGTGCELDWCEPVQARVRPVGVVVDPPVLDDLPSLVVVREQMFVEALVAQPAVEAFDKAILHRFARRDVVRVVWGHEYVLGCKPTRLQARRCE